MLRLPPWPSAPVRPPSLGFRGAGNPFRARESEISRLKMGEILEGFTVPQYRQALAEELDAYQRRLTNFQARRIHQPFPRPGPVPFIDWGHYQAGSWDQPLATAGLFSCSALLILDPCRQRHYLAHVLPHSRRQDVADSLRRFVAGGDLAQMQFWAMPGILTDFWQSMDRIREGLSSLDPALPRQIRYVGMAPAFPQEIPGLILWQGELFRYTLAQAPPPVKTLADYGAKDYLREQPVPLFFGFQPRPEA